MSEGSKGVQRINWIREIKNRWFFTNKTYDRFFTCYVLRATKKCDGRKIRGWIFNGSLTEVWIPYKDLRYTMLLYSWYLDIKNRRAGKVLVGE